MSPMMQPQPYQNSASEFPGTPPQQSVPGQMLNDSQQNPFVTQMQSCQTPAFQSAVPSQISAIQNEIKIRSDSKMETIQNQSTELSQDQNDPMEVVAKKTIKKRNYEESEGSDRSEKKAHRGQEKSRDLTSEAKFDGRVCSETPVSDTKKVSIQSRENFVGAKWIPDGKSGFKSEKCSPDGRTQPESRIFDLSCARKIKDSPRYRENKDDADLVSVINKRHINSNDDVLFKVYLIFFLS
jgi:hypothetical protein